MVSTFTCKVANPVWWGSMHAISSYRGNRPINTPTNTHTHTNPQTGPITIHCAAASLARRVIISPSSGPNPICAVCSTSSLFVLGLMFCWVSEWMSEWAWLNVLINTLHVISETSLSRRSFTLVLTTKSRTLKKQNTKKQQKIIEHPIKVKSKVHRIESV